MTTLVMLLFWALALRATFARGGASLINLFFASMPFGSLAVVPPALTGGLTFIPTPIVALLILARLLLRKGGLDIFLTTALSARRMLALTLFWLTATLVTLFMPRIMAGQTTIIPFRGEMLGETPLVPTVQNISQLAYLSISIFLVISLAAVLRAPGLRQPFLRAACLGAAVTVATGALDMIPAFAPLLAPFRTATYALLTEHEVLGAKRIVGLMPEASAYGTLCLGFLAFLHFARPAIANPSLRTRVAPALIALLALFTWLSTSTAAYVAMILFAALAALEATSRTFVTDRARIPRRQLPGRFALATLAILALLLVLILSPAIFDPIVTTFDRIVLQKSASSSFTERNLWTAVSWRATLDSWGIGVGVGSTRASNSAVGVISGTGLLGALLYAAFILQTLTRRADPADREATLLLAATRWAFPPTFACGLMIGISADFGTQLAILYGLAGALARPPD